jgi:hypothetical protein
MGNTPQRAARLHFRAPRFARQNENGPGSFKHRQARARRRRGCGVPIAGDNGLGTVDFAGCISRGKRSAAKCCDITQLVTRCPCGGEPGYIARRFSEQTSCG